MLPRISSKARNIWCISNSRIPRFLTCIIFLVTINLATFARCHVVSDTAIVPVYVVHQHTCWQVIINPYYCARLALMSPAAAAAAAQGHRRVSRNLNNNFGAYYNLHFSELLILHPIHPVHEVWLGHTNVPCIDFMKYGVFPCVGCQW